MLRIIRCKNFVAFNTNEINGRAGIQALGTYSNTLKNITIVGTFDRGDSTGYGINLYGKTNGGRTVNATFKASNILLLDNKNNALYNNPTTPYSSWNLDYVNSTANNPNITSDAYGSFTNLNPNAPTNLYNPPTGQGCIVYVPNNSNMKNAGLGGDIGANVVY